jgi:hypothetical protein
MNKIKLNDTIGCGINFLKEEIFFTHNGVYYGKYIYFFLFHINFIKKIYKNLFKIKVLLLNV